MSSFNNIEPVRLYPDQNKHNPTKSSQDCFQGILLERSEMAPPTFTPKKAVSLRARVGARAGNSPTANSNIGDLTSSSPPPPSSQPASTNTTVGGNSATTQPASNTTNTSTTPASGGGNSTAGRVTLRSQLTSQAVSNEGPMSSILRELNLSSPAATPSTQSTSSQAPVSGNAAQQPASQTSSTPTASTTARSASQTTSTQGSTSVDFHSQPPSQKSNALDGLKLPCEIRKDAQDAIANFKGFQLSSLDRPTNAGFVPGSLLDNDPALPSIPGLGQAVNASTPQQQQPTTSTNSCALETLQFYGSSNYPEHITQERPKLKGRATEADPNPFLTPAARKAGQELDIAQRTGDYSQLSIVQQTAIEEDAVVNRNPDPYNNSHNKTDNESWNQSANQDGSGPDANSPSSGAPQDNSIASQLQKAVDTICEGQGQQETLDRDGWPPSFYAEMRAAMNKPDTPTVYPDFSDGNPNDPASTEMDEDVLESERYDLLTLDQTRHDNDEEWYRNCGLYEPNSPESSKLSSVPSDLSAVCSITPDNYGLPAQQRDYNPDEHVEKPMDQLFDVARLQERGLYTPPPQQPQMEQTVQTAPQSSHMEQFRQKSVAYSQGLGMADGLANLSESADISTGHGAMNDYNGQFPTGHVPGQDLYVWNEPVDQDITMQGMADLQGNNDYSIGYGAAISHIDEVAQGYTEESLNRFLYPSRYCDVGDLGTGYDQQNVDYSAMSGFDGGTSNQLWLGDAPVLPVLPSTDESSLDIQNPGIPEHFLQPFDLLIECGNTDDLNSQVPPGDRPSQPHFASNEQSDVVMDEIQEDSEYLQEPSGPAVADWNTEDSHRQATPGDAPSQQHLTPNDQSIEGVGESQGPAVPQEPYTASVEDSNTENPNSQVPPGDAPSQNHLNWNSLENLKVDKQDGHVAYRVRGRSNSDPSHKDSDDESSDGEGEGEGPKGPKGPAWIPDPNWLPFAGRDCSVDDLTDRMAELLKKEHRKHAEQHQPELKARELPGQPAEDEGDDLYSATPPRSSSPLLANESSAVAPSELPEQPLGQLQGGDAPSPSSRRHFSDEELNAAYNENRVMSKLLLAVNKLSDAAYLSKSSVIGAGDTAREAVRLAEELQVSEALRARCIYYVGYAEAVLAKRNGRSLQSDATFSPIGPRRAEETTLLEHFEEARKAKGVYDEGAQAEKWVRHLSHADTSPIESKKAPSTKSKAGQASDSSRGTNRPLQHVDDSEWPRDAGKLRRRRGKPLNVDPGLWDALRTSTR